MNSFSEAYKYYGLHFQDDNSVIAREWAPGAQQVFLTGDFSKLILKYKKSFLHKILNN